MRMWKQAIAGLAVGVSLVLVGCGGSSSGSSNTSAAKSASTAKFVDNAVTGLEYTCGTSSTRKITGSQGVLSCDAGDTVHFYVGDVTLGSVTMTSKTAFITPATLAGAGADENNNIVINMTRFLMSLDADQDPSNGIQIDPASRITTGLAVDFNQTPTAFTGAIAPVLQAMTQNVSGGPFTLVDEGAAQNHVTLALFLSNAGYYQGTIQRSATSQSEIAFIVTRQGAIYGTNKTAQGLYAASGFDEEGSQLSTTGQGQDFKVDGSSGATYLVNVAMKNGTATGTSVDTTYPSFTANRTIAFDPVLDQTLVQKFQSLLPLGVNIGGSQQELFVIGADPSGSTVRGADYSTFNGGTPPSTNDANVLPDGAINFADVVSAKDNKIRVLGMSISGYVVDLTMDFSATQPTMTATWKQVNENRGGTTTDFVANVPVGGF